MTTTFRRGFLFATFLLVCAAPAHARYDFGSPSRATEEGRTPPSATEESRAQAYLHFALGRYYEEQAGDASRSEYIRRAIEEYKEALKADPNASDVVVRLAELYRRSGRIRDAVLEARQLVEADPDNLAAHRLLARIYRETLGEVEPGQPLPQTLPLAIAEYEAIARLSPSDSETLLDLARLYRLANDLPKAELTLKKVLALEPESEAGLAALASLYSDRGESQKAVELLEGLAERALSGRVLAALGDAYEVAENFENAIAAFQRALEQEPGNLPIRQRLAEALLRAGRPEEALEEFQKVLRTNPGDAQSLLRMSQILRYQKRFDEAQLALDKARALQPENLDIAFNQALLHEARGQFDAAIAVLTDMVGRMTRASGQYSAEEKSGRTAVLEHLGSLYRDSERFPEAVQTFEQMLALEEDTARRGYAQIAETHRQAREFDAAQAILRQGLERFPGEVELRLESASVLSDAGQLDQAVATVVQLIADEPEDRRRFYLALAQIYERHRRFQEAEVALHQAETFSRVPAELEMIHFLRGALHERQKQYAAAEQEFRRVLETNPKSAVTLNYLGYMLADQNQKLEEAVALLERALEIEPYNGAYLDSLGWAYFRQGKLDLAENFLLRAAARLSRDPTIQEHLGDLYYQLGRLDLAEKFWERARAEWQKATKVEFDADVFAKLEEKLRELKLRLAQQGRKPAGN